MKKKHAQNYLRDFIYLDLALVSSYLEQLVGGLPYEAEVSQEKRVGGDSGINLALFHVNLQGGGARSSTENQMIFWARYARLEDELRKANKLVELTGLKNIAQLKPHILFLFSGATWFEPDWSGWNSGMSLAKIIIDKFRQLGALEALNQAQPDINGMVPMLLGPGGNPIVALQKDALSELLPSDLPLEPPANIRRLFKPTAVSISFELESCKKQLKFEGSASLQNFTPHRIERCIVSSIQEDVDVLGLVTECKGNVFQFVPLAIFVKV